LVIASVILFSGCLCIWPAEVLSGCVKGSGKTLSEERLAAGFDSIQADGPVTVHVLSGRPYEVVVDVEDNIVDLVRAKVEGNTLEVDVADVCVIEAKPIVVRVSGRDIRGLSATRGARIVTDAELAVDALKLTAASEGRIEASVTAKRLRASATKGGAIFLGGEAADFQAYASEAGNVKAYGLIAEKTIATAESAGAVEAYASKELTIRASSGGRIFYKGGASVKKEVSGDSSAVKTG